MEAGEIVIVTDTSNYVSEHSENTPFKAEITSITDYGCLWVKSLVTGKEYELYQFQILED